MLSRLPRNASRNCVVVLLNTALCFVRFLGCSKRFANYANAAKTSCSALGRVIINYVCATLNYSNLACAAVGFWDLYVPLSRAAQLLFMFFLNYCIFWLTRSKVLLYCVHSVIKRYSKELSNVDPQCNVCSVVQLLGNAKHTQLRSCWLGH